jgi:hypothetical protein
MIVRNQITSVMSDEIDNNRVILQKAPNFASTFRNLQDLKGLSMTDNRQDSLAEKRREKHTYGRPNLPPLSFLSGSVHHCPLLPPKKSIESPVIRTPQNPAPDQNFLRLHRSRRVNHWRRRSFRMCS